MKLTSLTRHQPRRLPRHQLLQLPRGRRPAKPTTGDDDVPGHALNLALCNKLLQSAGRHVAACSCPARYTGTARPSRPLGRLRRPSCSRISRLTSPPSARPLVSFITAPTIAPIAFGLPALICSAALGLASIAAATIASARRCRRSGRGPRARRSRPGRRPRRPARPARSCRCRGRSSSPGPAPTRAASASGSTLESAAATSSSGLAQRRGELAGDPVGDHLRLDPVGRAATRSK